MVSYVKIKDNLRDRYRLRSATFKFILGNHCAYCGSEEDLEIDHIERRTKEIDLRREWGRPWPQLLKELSKCQLLCKGCHKAKSDNEKRTSGDYGSSAKLNYQDAERIRIKLQLGVSRSELCRQYCVSDRCIRDIRDNKTYLVNPQFVL